MRRSSIAAALLLVAFGAGGAAAQTKTGTSMAQFLLIEPSARLTGMGNVGVALGRGLDGVYYNPAAIAGAERYGVTFTHCYWLADMSYDYVAVAIPAGRWGSLYTAVTSLTSGEIDVRTVTQPLGTGERYTVSDVAIGVGYGLPLTDRFSAGGEVTFVQETIWNSSASTFTISIGTLYRVTENGLHIGAGLAHFGTQTGYDGNDLRITYDSDPSRNGDNGTLPGESFTGDFPVPVLFRFGVGMPYRFNRTTRLEVEVDAFHPSDNTESMSVGFELTLADRLSLRTGWQRALEQDTEVGWTLGAGVAGVWQPSRFRIDYAWADHGRLDSTQRFSLGIVF